MQVFAEVRDLVIGIAWPVTVLVAVFLLRREIRTAIVAIRDRIAAANSGELVAGPVSLRWSGAIEAASTAILQLPVEVEDEAMGETRQAAKRPELTASITPVKSVVDAYESVRAALLVMPAPVPDQPDLLLGADAGTLAQALSRVGALDWQLADAIQVLTDLRESLLSEARPTVSSENARDYITLARAVLSRLPAGGAADRAPGDEEEASA
jgi:hypothetical protein